MFPIFQKLVSRKWVVVEQNRHTFGPRVYLVFMGYFIPLQIAGISKMARGRVKPTEI